MRLMIVALMLAVGAAALCAQPGNPYCSWCQVTYSEPDYGGLVYTGYQSPGPLIGFQAAGCTDGIYDYQMATYGQLGWSCFQGEVSGYVQEWTNRYQGAVYVQVSANRFMPPGFWYFNPSYAWCRGPSFYTVIYMPRDIWPDSC